MQFQPDSTEHDPEHPSDDSVFKSSHTSPTSKAPFPQGGDGQSSLIGGPVLHAVQIPHKAVAL